MENRRESWADADVSEDTARMPERRKGVVEKECRGRGMGRIRATDCQRREFFSYDLADIEDRGGHIYVKDQVEFDPQHEQTSSYARNITVIRTAEEAKAEVSGPAVVETGVIAVLKDSFGFINCCDRDHRLFFHYSEVQNGEANLHPGDEVEFVVIENERSGKLNGASVRVVPKGTVTFEKILEEKLEGVVEKELKRGGYRAKLEEAFGGKIVWTDENGTQETLPFTGRDIDPKQQLRTGDKVEFNVIVDKPTGRRGATNIVKLVTHVDLPRETGVVSSVKDSFGFIKCAERDERLFFHFSEMADQGHVIRPGDEVEFSIVKNDRSGRSNGVNIVILPKGTVSFVNIDETRVQGVVEAVPPKGKGSFFTRRPEESSQPGTIVLSTANEPQSAENGEKVEAKVEAAASQGEECKESNAETKNEGDEETTAAAEAVKFPFLLKDVTDGANPNVGDTVEFCIATDKRNGKKSAVQVTVTATPEPEVETGVVSSVKDTFGFITCINREKKDRLFFHHSEVSGGKVRPGTEVSFQVSMNTRTSQANATHVTILAPGTLKVKETSAEVSRGIVRKAIQVDQRYYRRGRGFGHREKETEKAFGLIEVITDQPTAVEAADDAPEIADGDGGEADADADAVVNGDAEGEGEGGQNDSVVVDADKEDGDEEALNDSLDSNAGDGETQTPKKKGRGGRGAKKYAFTQDDVDDLRLTLGVGDEVEFNTVLDKRSGKMSATNVKLIKAAPDKDAVEALTGEELETAKSSAVVARGWVMSLKASFGFIRCLYRDNKLFFQLSDVGEEDQSKVCVGQEVEFKMVTKPNSEEQYGIELTLLSEGTICSGLPVETGVVASASIRSGTITRNCKEVEHPLAFSNVDVEKSSLTSEIKSGDEVEYSVDFDSKTQALAARKVKIVKAAKPPPSVQKRLKSAEEGGAAKLQFRIAKGPDGTKGFPAGRGKPIAAASANAPAPSAPATEAAPNGTSDSPSEVEKEKTPGQFEDADAA